MSLRLADDSSELHWRVSSEWHWVEPVDPRVNANGDFSQRGKASAARVNSSASLRADWKANLGGIRKIDFYGKLSLRLLGIGRIEFRDYVARQVLSFSICPPDAVHFRREDL